LADRLDPYCKLLVFEHELMRAGLDWADLRAGLEKARGVRDVYCDSVLAAVLADSDHGLTPDEILAFNKARAPLKPGDVEKVRFAARLWALDVQYPELGGLYDRLHDAGRMKDVILTPAEVDEASRTPPAGGRAALRGAWIREHHGDGWRGDWQYVWEAASGEC